MKSLNNQPANEKTTILLKKEAEMGNTIIELKNISKNFGEQQVLRGIDLNIYENEFLTPQAPTNISISIIVFEKLGHILKSSVAKPVVVIILDTVNAA